MTYDDIRRRMLEALSTGKSFYPSKLFRAAMVSPDDDEARIEAMKVWFDMTEAGELIGVATEYGDLQWRRYIPGEPFTTMGPFGTTMYVPGPGFDAYVAECEANDAALAAMTSEQWQELEDELDKLDIEPPDFS